MRTPGLAMLLALGCVQSAVAAPDAQRGQRLFLQCQACHGVAKGQPHKIGPNLYGTVGAAAATRPGFAYSPALTKAALQWNDATLDRWLTSPNVLVPGNKMVFAGMARAQDRADLIAYLKRATR